MENILLGLEQVADPAVILYIGMGVMVGVVFGALPGLTATMGIALMAPLTFGMPTLLALPFLIGVYRGGLHGGAITAIMIGVPGTPANVPTVLDGYELAKKGYPQSALRYALFASVAGALLSSVLLFTLITPVASLALEIGSPEIFGILLFSMTLVTYISGARLSKGLMAAALGMFVGMIGLDPMVGTPRFTFGTVGLLGGVPMIAMFIGLFALPELVGPVEQRIAKRSGRVPSAAESARPSFSAPDDNIRLRDVIRHYWRRILVSASIGSFVGVLPGVGAETSPWLSYAAAKRGKRGKKFGTGEPEGIIAPEVATDAVVGGAFVPLLVFGIPGDVPLAVMLGALLAQGVRPRPSLIVDDPALLFGIVASVLVSSILLYVIVRPFTRFVRLIVYIPNWVLVPVILGLCVAGAFGVNNATFDLVVMTVFGFVGYAMRKTGVPLAPFVLAFVLSARFETSFRQSLLLERSFLVFVQNPFVLIMIILSLAVIASSVIMNARQRTRGMSSEETTP